MTRRVQPIRPSEIASEKATTAPDAVLRAFNALITENYSNSGAKILQKDVVGRLIAAGLDRAEIFRRGWLDVEDIYREAGWKVKYDKPGYNETYDAYFVFSKANGK